MNRKTASPLATILALGAIGCSGATQTLAPEPQPQPEPEPEPPAPVLPANAIYVNNFSDLALYDTQAAGERHAAGEEITAADVRARCFNTYPEADGTYKEHPVRVTDIEFGAINVGTENRPDWKFHASRVYLACEDSEDSSRTTGTRWYAEQGDTRVPGFAAPPAQGWDSNLRSELQIVLSGIDPTEEMSALTALPHDNGTYIEISFPTGASELTK